MPNLDSAKKRVRIEAKRRARNHSVKSATRTMVVKARNAIALSATEPDTEAAVKEALSQLDKAITKGVIHRNNAARRKSRLMARLHKAQAPVLATKATSATKTRTSTRSARPKATTKPAATGATAASKAKKK